MTPSFFCGKPKLGLLLSLLVLSACGVQTPTIANSSDSVASFLHTGLETSCNSCHIGQRPNGPVGPAATFDHGLSAYGGQNDCIQCHKSNEGVSWSGGLFAHAPQPSTCSLCHNAERPTTNVGSPPFSHTLNGTGDCFACHAQSTTTYVSLSDWAGGQSMPTGLIGPVTLSATVGVPTFSGVTITNITNSSVSLPQQMLHNSAQISGTIMVSCANCHSGASTGSYTGGVFHNSIVTAGGTQPTSCSDCHTSGKPVGFIGPQGANRSPASAEMRHEAVAWSSTTAGVWSPTTNALVTQDCATCHTNTGVAWSAAKYHASLSAAGQAQPSSCLDCHANSRPMAAVGSTGFVHSSDGGMADCMTCHSSISAPSNNYTSWVGTGTFSHSGVTSCASCHSTQRPTSSSGWTQTTWSTATTTYDLATHGGSNDCYSCHASSLTSTFTSMANWQGGTFTHSPAPTACLTCHTYPTSATAPDITGTGLTYQDHSSFGGQDCAGCHTAPPNYTALTGWGGASSTPSGLVNGTGFAWNFWSTAATTVTYTAGTSYSTAVSTVGLQSLPQQMQHSAVPAATLANCTSCHTVGKVASSGTRYHTSISSQPTSCVICHNPGGVPTGSVGPVTGSTNAPEMNHAAKYGSGNVISTAQDCAACHSNAVGTSWQGGVFHTNTSGNTVTACASCHIPKMPTTVSTSSVTYTPAGGTGLPQHFLHTSASVTQDCSTCHTAMGSSNTWVTSTKFHNIVTSTLTTCAACHSSDTPSGTTSMPVGTTNGKYIHSTSYSSEDCASCHGNQTSTTQWIMTSGGTPTSAPTANQGVSWAGGVYDHKVGSGKVGSCTSCHSSSYGNGHPQPSGYDSEKTSYFPCKTCH